MKFSNTIISGVFFFFFLLLFSCTDKRPQNISHPTTRDTIKPPHITTLANLPDSLQPKRMLLDTLPKPITVDLSPTHGVSKNKAATNANLLPPIKVLAKNNITLTTYTSDNGLSGNYVVDMKQDKLGIIWFVTDKGLCSYDGKSFNHFTKKNGLISSDVTCIYIDKANNLWCGTDKGISVYNGSTFTNYKSSNGITFERASCILQDKKERMWFGLDGNGLICFDKNKFLTYSTKQGLIDNRVRSLQEDKYGNIWIGTFNKGASCFNGNKFINYTTNEGLSDNEVLCIGKDKNGDLWFGGGPNGVTLYDGKSFSKYPFIVVHSIVTDKSGSIWFGTLGGGIFQYNWLSSPKGKPIFNHFTNSDGMDINTTGDSTLSTCIQALNSANVGSILEDKNGNMWFGTMGGGVSRFEGKSMTNFTVDQGLLSDDILSITEDKKGNLWLGELNLGLQVYDGNTFYSYEYNNGSNAINAFCGTADTAGNMWFGTYWGLRKFEGKGFSKFDRPQHLLYSIYPILGDKVGKIWFGLSGNYGATGLGLCCFDGKTFTTYTTSQGLGNNLIKSLYEGRNGNIWIGTNGGGLSRFDGKSFINYTTDQGLADNEVMGIAEDNNRNLYIGTTGGLSRFDGKSFFRITEKPAGILIDKQGEIVMATDSGFAILSKFIPIGSKNANNLDASNSLSNLELLNNYIPKISVYGQYTGWPAKDIGVMYCDSHGIIWAQSGTEQTNKRKLVRFDPSALDKNSSPPTLIIHSIKVNEENICWNDLIKKEKKLLKFMN